VLHVTTRTGSELPGYSSSIHELALVPHPSEGGGLVHQLALDPEGVVRRSSLIVREKIHV